MKKILFSLSAFTLFITGVFIVILFNSSPLDSGKSVVPMFFIFALLCIAFLLITINMIYLNFKKKQISNRKLSIVARRCFFVSLILVGLAVFSAMGVLNALSGATFVIAVILIEFFVQNKSGEASSE